ncbi:unnamed protein product [Pleuronectes platessa]|uniref:Uncharacterized protein n=1 Tax=Pleuronectes platessa TaxID=8262 RepID=A0A9N7UTT1_PLEPL|nr:unnamed protein product [Pleuronectes platessa]
MFGARRASERAPAQEERKRRKSSPGWRACRGKRRAAKNFRAEPKQNSRSTRRVTLVRLRPRGGCMAKTAAFDTRSECAIKIKNLALQPEAVGERRRPQRLITPSHDSTHQDSSSNKSISL